MNPRSNVLKEYKLRLKRQRLLWRAFRARHQLRQVSGGNVPGAGVLLFSTVRNEAARLPQFLAHYRRLGVAHFVFVDNDSTDGSVEGLAQQADCSVWRANQSYRASRFGVDWTMWLQRRFAHNRWCLVADADELLVFDGDDQWDLNTLAEKLDLAGRRAFGALMLDLYPEGPIGKQDFSPGDNPLDVLTHFDAAPFRQARQEPKGNLWVQGGARERAFFATAPDRSPTLNKLPFIKWHRSFAWVNSTHSVLPRRLNFEYAGPPCVAQSERPQTMARTPAPSGALLHTKFLPEVIEKSADERVRRQHFHSPDDFEDYYLEIESGPNLYNSHSTRYLGPSQLVKLGLISPREWL